MESFAGQRTEVSYSKCENCGSQAVFATVFAAEHRVQRCVRCEGWSYVGPVDAPAEKIYDRDYFSGGEYADYAASLPAQRRNFERKMRLLSQADVALNRDSRVLEIGCATGAFLATLRDAGINQLIGVEVSAYAREQARTDGFTVFSPSDLELVGALEELRPNIIVAWDVWEHLDRPATIIERYLQVADRGASVALTTVDASSGVARLRGPRWRQFHPPTHLHYPTRASFRDFFRAHAMQVQMHRAFGYYRPALEYLRVLGLEPVLRGRERLRTWPVYLNLWDTQFVVARRLA